MTRIVRRSRWLGFAIILAAGCTKPPAYATKAAPIAAVASPSAKPGEVVAAQPTADTKSAAEAYAKEFLAAVQAGKASAAMLTPAFKKWIADPLSPEERELGYSDTIAGQWLERFSNSVPAPALTAASGSGDTYVLTGGVAGEAPKHIALRVMKLDGAWRTDWFFASVAGPVSATLPTGDEAYPTFAAVAFLDGLLGNSDRIAEGTMSTTFKMGIAPPFPSDKRGYNRGILSSKFGEFRGGFNGYVITKVEAGTVTGELSKGGTTKPFTMKLVKGDRPTDWLIADFRMD